MRILRLFLFVLFTSTCLNLSAQCYEATRKKGIDQYNKGEYQAASRFFEAAKYCADLPKNNDLNSWLDKCVITVKLSDHSLVFDSELNDDQVVEVITKAKSFKVTDPPSWVTIVQDGKSLIVSCEDNEVVASREAEVIVTAAGKTAVLKIYQAAADVLVDVDPNVLAFSSKADTAYVRVFSNITEWEIESVPSWLAAERRNDYVMIACFDSPLPDVREADVLINVSEESYPIHVSQLPGDTILRAGKKEIIFNNGYSSENFYVTCNMPQWNASTTDSWLEVERRNDSVKVFATENPSVFSRHGTVRVNCGTHHGEVLVHQRPHVSTLVMPESELKESADVAAESVSVTSYPSELVVYIDDSIRKTTPFEYFIDYEHHSMTVGFESRDFLFNEKQKDIVFEPGLRFAAVTFDKLGLQSGYINAKGLGAYSHFATTRPMVEEFVSDSPKADGYHFLVGPVYSPIKYAAVYAGIGVGIHEGPVVKNVPKFGLDYEFGVMGMFKNAMVSMGYRISDYSTPGNKAKDNTFIFGLGGYLKRYYDTRFEEGKRFCTSDSRRWWSINYMSRPVTGSKGAMISDIGKGKVRTYFKGMYAQPADTVRNIDASFGFLFTPVDGLIDFCIGAGAGTSIDKKPNLVTVEAEAGFVVNIWRIPLTVMLHEANLVKVYGKEYLNPAPHLYVDFGIGIHLGEFNRSSYK